MKVNYGGYIDKCQSSPTENRLLTVLTVQNT